MIEYAFACLAMLIFVGLKSAQQRNVAFDHYAWIPPTSVAMSWCEFYVLGYVALDVTTSGLTWLFFLKASGLGLAAGTGSLVATLLHGRFLGRGSSSGVMAQGSTEVRGGKTESKEVGESPDAGTRPSPYDCSIRRGGN